MVLEESVIKGFRLGYTNDRDDDFEKKIYSNELYMTTAWKSLSDIGVYEKNDVYCVDNGVVKREFVKGKRGVWNLVLSSGDGLGLMELSERLKLRFPEEPVKVRVL